MIVLEFQTLESSKASKAWHMPISFTGMRLFDALTCVYLAYTLSLSLSGCHRNKEMSEAANNRLKMGEDDEFLCLTPSSFPGGRWIRTNTRPAVKVLSGGDNGSAIQTGFPAEQYFKNNE